MSDPSGELAAPVVLLFLKAPRAGLVKTRLAAAIGVTEALAVYRALAERQLRAMPDGWRLVVHFTPADAEPEMRAWLGDELRYRAQGEGDLGARLTDAFAAAFAGGATHVLAIGGDCPDLDEAVLREAIGALTETDVVIGPARDGGYYLVGLRAPAPELFAAIPWSTAEVLALTLARARAAQLTVRLLAELDDIDDQASLERWRDRIADPAASRQRSPREC